MFLLVLCCLLFSCSKNNTVLPTISLDADQIPVLHTENVVSLISDSGVTRYRMIAKVWDVFSSEDDNLWYFPEGIYVEQFDSLLNVKASAVADTAYFFSNESLWHLVNNVKMVNLKQDQFETTELFWNTKIGKIYSDSLVSIKNADGNSFKVIGFTSNQEMTNYSWGKMLQSTIVSNQENTLTDDNVDSLSVNDRQN